MKIKLGKSFYFPFVSFWAIDAIVVFLANALYPNEVVLGSIYIKPLWFAVLVSSFIWTLLVWHSGNWFQNAKPKGRMKMMFFYFLANSIAIWVVARLAPFTGLGITAYYWAIAIGFVANFLQWLSWQGLKKVK